MKRTALCAILAAIALPLGWARADDLEQGFISPVDATRPRCYWYWLDGHITKDGITKDLEAMKRVGIGEAYIGMISDQSGVPANPNLKALTDPWWDTMVHAVREGSRIGVDIGVFNSPGWSQSGGPWVKPAQTMRYVALPEVRLHGPMRFDGKLPAPEGTFQDIAVMAFPAPDSDQTTAGKQTRTSKTIDIEFPASITARSVSIQPTREITVTAELSVSDDGKTYRPLKQLIVDRHRLDVMVGPMTRAPIVESFPATQGRFFRLTFSGDCEVGDVVVSPAARVERFPEKQLGKVYEEPQPPFEFYSWPLSSEPNQQPLVVPTASVANLTKQMDADGTLHWDVPAGDWVVLRAGMRPTGSRNSPAAPEATGLEIDKMNRRHVASHFDAYIGELLRRVPENERKAWKHVVADSYERGPQNWTDGFAADFTKRYGYDPLPYLPTMTGRVVGSVDQSDRFLWDLRRMVADRIAEDYVGGLKDICNKNGLKLWLENYGHWGFPSEFLKYGGATDEVAGEFWCGGADGTLNSLGSVELRDASSAAHTYGKNAVFAEAFTGGPTFVNSPRDLKARGDWAFCQGINQFTLHVYIHQPDERLPGMSAWFGSEFNRHTTWFEMSKAWFDYQRRCTHLLQHGLHAADVAYFIGEDAPKMTGLRQPALPDGYDFDYINAEVLLTRATVQSGRLTLPDGMSYGLLVLPPSQTMRPEVLTKIAKFVDQGLAVFGPLPTRSPSLQNFPNSDAEIQRLATALKDKISDGPQLQAVLKTPADVSGLPPQQVLFIHRRSDDADVYFLSNQSDAAMSIQPVFRISGMASEVWHPDSGVIERVASQPADAGTKVPLHLDGHGSVFVVFRKTSDRPLPDAPATVTGLQIVKATYAAIDGSGSGDVTERLRQQVANGALHSAVTVDGLGGDPARFHVKQLHLDYTLNGKAASATYGENELIALTTGDRIAGPWKVQFADQAFTFDSLTSWTNRPEDTLKYFSGTATYSIQFNAAEIGKRVVLDLGAVDCIAEVTLNGHSFPAVWKYPYEVDVTTAIKAGSNELSVKVANTWHNRLVGLKRAPNTPGLAPAWTSTMPGYGPQESLLPAGLIGPVTVRGTAIK